MNLRGQHGEAHPRAKLTNEQAREICRLRHEGLTYKAIAEQFVVTLHTVRLIVLGKRWQEATEGYRDFPATDSRGQIVRV